MKISRFIILIFMLYGCSLKNAETVTIYGKIWGTYGKWASRVYTPEAYLVSQSWTKVEPWPDSMEFQYVKITGKLYINPYTYGNDSVKQINYVKYLIKDAKVEVIEDDSLICEIDYNIGKCVEFRRFIKRLQQDKVIDSIVKGDTIYFLKDKNNQGAYTSSHFSLEGSKRIQIEVEELLRSNKINEFFKLSELPCDKNSDYDLIITKFERNGSVFIEKEYRITGNHEKIDIQEK